MNSFQKVLNNYFKLTIYILFLFISLIVKDDKLQLTFDKYNEDKTFKDFSHFGFVYINTKELGKVAMIFYSVDGILN